MTLSKSAPILLLKETGNLYKSMNIFKFYKDTERESFLKIKKEYPWAKLAEKKVEKDPDITRIK